jgi:UDP-MurNAc hydroxylase
MKLTNIGGATAILQHAGKRMLFDPWMDEGIYHGAWHHYPPLKLGLKDLGHLDYVYISHIHEDHCSLKTVDAINRDAEIIIMDRAPEIPNFISNFLRYNQFTFKKVHLIRPYTPTQIADDLHVEMLEADPSNKYSFLVDSAMMLRWGDTIVYNANDCAPHQKSTQYIKNHYPQIDLGLIPYSGGSGYPGCYTNLSDADKLAEKKRISELRYEVFVDTVEELDPKRVLPFADQYVIAGSRSHLNRFSPHPPSPAGVREPLTKRGLQAKLLLLNSGQTFDFDTETLFPDAPYDAPTEEDRKVFISERLKSWRYDHEKVLFRDVVPIDRLLEHARRRLWAAQNRYKEFPNTNLYLHVTSKQETFLIDLQKEGVVRVPDREKLVEPYIKISTDHTLLTMLLINHVSWNIADGALLLEYDRVPNDYDPRTYALLNFLTV